MAFEIDQIRLYGHYDTDTGKVRTANVYWVEGIDRQLSIAELVMAICLERAASMEDGIIKIMQDMQDTNIAIEDLTRTESLLVAKQESGTSGSKFSDFTDDAKAIPTDATLDTDVVQWLSDHGVAVGSVSTGSALSKDDVQALITATESRLDNLNSLSQQKMIELQSETNKRNQAYDLISSMVKSIGTANQAITANFR